MGPVMDLAKAVSECPSGGQIICCQATFAGILDQQARILSTVPEHADHDLLYDMLRCATLLLVTKCLGFPVNQLYHSEYVLVAVCPCHTVTEVNLASPNHLRTVEPTARTHL